MRYEYKVVPFLGMVKRGEKDAAFKVAEQLQQIIAEHATPPWEFYRIDPVQIEVRPGCLAAMLGVRSDYIRFDQIIFRRVIED